MGGRHQKNGAKRGRYVISVDTFGSLVDTIYEAGLDARRWPETLAQLAGATGANVADLRIADASRNMLAIFSSGMAPSAIETYRKYYSQLDPIRPAAEQRPTGTIVTDQDIMPKQLLTRTAFYNEWVRPQDFHDCTMVTLFRDAMRAAVICFAAPERVDTFPNRSLELLGRLMPHLARATRVTLKLAELEALSNSGLAALDYLSEAVILVDFRSRVEFANRAAEAMLASADGIRVDTSGLCAASSAQTMALRRLIALTAHAEGVSSAGGSLLLKRRSGRRPLSVTIAPIRRETAWGSMTPAMAVVFVADPDQDAESSQSRLRALYGITGAEAKVANLVSSGSGVKGAARTLGIAPSTARTHLHRVFEKTGTRRQAELANLVNRLALHRPYLAEGDKGKGAPI
jgi:DNA-binding CsgD family transcriptional regulator